MTRYQHYRSGKLYGIRYSFDEIGDGIPPHDHGTDLAHNIIVMSGRVQLQVHGEPHLDLGPGVHDFDWSKRHAIYALEPNTQILHMCLNGMPLGYDHLPPSELKGQLTFRGLH